MQLQGCAGVCSSSRWGVEAGTRPRGAYIMPQLAAAAVGGCQAGRCPCSCVCQAEAWCNGPDNHAALPWGVNAALC